MSEPIPCRLFIRLPAGGDFDRALEAALSNPEAASFLLPKGLADEKARSAVRRIQASDRPALVIDDLDLRAMLQADGVHLTDPSAARAIRGKLGDGLVLGVECPLERHACMEAADGGADYVAIRATEANIEDAMELLVWWHEMMTTPIVVLADLPGSPEALENYADFLSPSAA